MRKLCIALLLTCLIAITSFAAPITTWEIVRADYGSGNRWVDVTDRVRSLVQDNSLNFRVDANTLGASERQGRNRTLRLLLKGRDGSTQQMTFRESQQVNLQVYNAYQGSLRVTRAIYGTDDRNTDVTSRLNSMLQNNQINILVTNQSMGGDPAPNQRKTLTVEYMMNGRNERATVRENETLNLTSGYPTENTLQISRATYGSGNRTSDVTSRLNSQVRGDHLNLLVNNDTMGGDPAPNQRKTLTVEYMMNGRNERATVRENETLNLTSGYPTQNTLQINRATYGSGYRTSDVTSRLNSQIRDDQLNLQVNNDTMGGDPAPNEAKTLTVQYAMNGQNNQVVVREGDPLRLPYGNGYLSNDNNNYGNNDNAQLTQRVVCESLQSDSNRRKYCAANTSGGVRLSRTLGDSQCTEGSTWGYDNGGVWVDRGCRGEFEMRGNRRRSSITGGTTIATGTVVSVRTNEVIDSKNATEGQSFSGTIATDLLDNTGAVLIPRGSDVELVIRGSNGGGMTSASELVLDMNSVTVDGSKYYISTEDLQQQGGEGVGANKKTGIMVGGGAGLGTLIGALVGGAKGAAIGAVIGAGAGLGTEVLTKGKQVRVPSETVLNFRLDRDLRLQTRR